MFVKGKSGNKAGRPPGIRLATLEASTQWRERLRALLLSEAYQQELKARLLAGTLPPIVEAKLFSYAFGEPPKAPDDKQNGMIVQLGFLGFMPTEQSAGISQGPTQGPTRPTQLLIETRAVEDSSPGRNGATEDLGLPVSQSPITSPLKP